MPPADSFRNGEQITIGSEFRLLPGWSFDTAPPNLGEIELFGTLGLNTTADAEVCFFDCVDVGSVLPDASLPPTKVSLATIDTTFPIPLDPLEMATLLVSLVPDDPFWDTLASIIGPVETELIKNTVRFDGASALATYIANFTPLGNFGGYMGLPAVQTSDARSGNKLLASGTHKYVDLLVDLDGVTLEVISRVTNQDVPVLEFTIYPLCVGATCFAAGYDTIDFDAVSKLYQDEEYEFDPVPRVKLEFPQAVHFRVVDCDTTTAFNYYDPEFPGTIGPLKTLVDASDIDPPFGIPNPVPSGNEVEVPENWLVCEAVSDIVVFNAGDEVKIDFPNGPHTVDVEPTFLLPNLVSNETTNRFEQSLVGSVASLNFFIGSEELVSPRTLREEVCVDLAFGGESCTPEIRYPGFDTDSVSIEIGPLYTQTIPLFAFSDNGLYTAFTPPWILEGFNTVGGASFTLDAETQEVAVITGPTQLAEGEEGIFDCLASIEIDFGESLICSWDFGDGIVATGDVVAHTYDDNGPVPTLEYTVKLTVDDGHKTVDIATQQVLVTNVTPTLNAGSNKTINEGDETGLGIDLFGRNLITNAGAEDGTAFWSTSGGLTTDAYAAPGTASPSTVVLVDSSTPGYHNSGIGRSLDGNLPLFPKEGPVKRAHWPAELEARDVVGGNDGTLIGGTGFTAGAVGQGFLFDGVNDYVSVPNSNSLDVTSRYTVTAWVYLDDTPNLGTYRPILTRGAVNADDIEIYVQINSNDLIVAHNRGNGGPNATYPFSDPPFGQLFHLAVTFDGVHAHAYYNGVKQTLDPDHGHAAPIDTNKGWTIGRVDHSAFDNVTGNCGGSQTCYFRGVIDELKIYPSQLSVAQINDDRFQLTDEPIVVGTSEPNLGAASGVLGSWLGGFAPSGGSWTGGPVGIPTPWPEYQEDAIVYVIDAGEGGITDLQGFFGVDNGVYVWVDGSFRFGASEPGGTVAYEYNPNNVSALNLGSLSPGLHYIQILRSDHGGLRGYEVLITGTVQGGRPATNSPGPIRRGGSYFFGGENASSGGASQRIDVRQGAELIDEDANFTLSAFLGGYDGQDDGATLTAIFRNDSLSEISRSTIGPNNSAARGGVTGLPFSSLSGTVPAGTRWIDVVLSMDRQAGSDADGYADQTFFAMFAPAGANLDDDGRGDTHSALINWGDLSALDVAQVNQEPGSATFLGSHRYGDNGVYTVTATAEDDDHAALGNGRVADAILITVLNLPPDVIGRANVFVEGEASTRLLATFTDPGFNDAPFTATIDWGDGTGVQSASVNQAGQVNGIHTYNLGGGPGDPSQSRVATLTVTDKDGGSTVVLLSHTIVNFRIPAIEAGSDRFITEGGSIPAPTGSFTAADTSASPTELRYEYEWDYGDFTTHGPVDLGVRDFPQNVDVIAPAHSYGDDGQFVVTLTVRAYATASGRLTTAKSATFLVTVSNADPVVEAGGNRTVNEGSTTTLNPATFTDPGLSDTHTATVNWGDGTPLTQGVVDQAARTVSGNHVYADNGAYTVTVTLTDDDDGVHFDTFLYTVNNVAPAVGVATPPSTPEGSLVSLGATFSDAGSADTHTATIFWGDGDFEAGTVSQAGGTVTGSHVYDDNGFYTVTVRVCDDDGVCTDGQATAGITNADPVVFAPGNTGVIEGEQLNLSTSFADAGTADTHTANISWGDGTSSAGVVDQGTNGLTGSHVYADDGAYTVTITVTDDDTDSGQGGFGVTVDNVPVEIVALELKSVQPVLSEGSLLDLTVDFNDAGTLDAHSGTIDWGDGSPIQAGTITETPFGPPGSVSGANGTLTASHTYPDGGDYDVTVCLGDDDSTTCGSSTVTVSNVAPTVSAGGNHNIDEGDSISLDPATFSDPGYDNPAAGSSEDFTATIDWGDGTTEPVGDIALVENPGGPGSPSTGTVQASHVYGDNDTFVVGVCVADDDHDPASPVPVLGEGCDSFTVVVNNVAPTLDAGPDILAIEGTQIALAPATFSDPGFDIPTGGTFEDFTATVDWGDGFIEPAAGILIGETPGGEGVATQGTIVALHDYADDGLYTVTVCVSDDDGDGVCDTFTVETFNVTPTPEAGADITIPVRIGFTLQGTWFDPGTTFDEPYSWSWTPLDSQLDNAGVLWPVTSGTASYGDTIDYPAAIPVAGVYRFEFTVTDDAGDTASDIVTVTVESRWVVFATHSTHLRKSTVVESGDVGAPFAGEPRFLSDKSEVVIGDRVIVAPGSAVYADTLKPRNKSLVDLVYVNDVEKGNGVITTVVSPLVAGLGLPTVPTPNAVPGTGETWYNGTKGDCKKHTCFDSGDVLVAGNYGELKSRSGKKNRPVIIVLAGGEYHFEEIDLSSWARVEALGPVTIHVAGKVDTGQSTYFGPAAGSGISASDILLLVAGQNGNKGKINSHPNAVDFGDKNELHLNVYAPNGTLHIRKSGVATGAFIAKWVLIGDKVTLNVDAAWVD